MKTCAWCATGGWTLLVAAGFLGGTSELVATAVGALLSGAALVALAGTRPR